jgi:hypothetical protein
MEETYKCEKCRLEFAFKDEGIPNTCFECDMPYCEYCMCEDKGMCYECIYEKSDYDDDDESEEEKK